MFGEFLVFFWFRSAYVASLTKTDRRTDGQTGGQTDRQMDGRAYLLGVRL